MNLVRVGNDEKENPLKKKLTEGSEKLEKTEKSVRVAAGEELKEIVDQLKTILQNLHFRRFNHGKR